MRLFFCTLLIFANTLQEMHLLMVICVFTDMMSLCCNFFQCVAVYITGTCDEQNHV